MSARSLVVASAFAATALAQTSVTSLYLYGYEGENVVASVITAAPEATSYLISCAEGTDATDCGFGPGVTFVEGPSTAEVHFTEEDAITVDATCEVAAPTATCVETDAGPAANFPGTSTSVLTDVSSSLTPVTITAGLDLLSSGSSATTTGSSASSSGSSTAASSSSESSGASKTTGATGKASGTASSTSSSSSSSSTSASAADRTVLNLAIAGVAGLVGLVMAL